MFTHVDLKVHARHTGACSPKMVAWLGTFLSNRKTSSASEINHMCCDEGLDKLLQNLGVHMRTASHIYINDVLPRLPDLPNELQELQHREHP